MKLLLIIIALIFFIYLLTSSIIYIFFQRKHIKLNYRRRMKRKSRIHRVVLHQLQKVETNQPLTEEDQKQLVSILKKKIDKEVFNELLIKMHKYDRSSQAVKALMAYYPHYIDEQLRQLPKRKQMERVAMAYLLGVYGVQTDDINRFLIEAIQSNSIYLKYNAFKSIAAIGNQSSFITALKLLSEDIEQLDNKLFVDVVDRYNGDHFELNKQLIQQFNTLTVNTKIIVIEHFTHVETNQLSHFLFERLITRADNKEVLLAIIKYFTEVQYEPVKANLIELLKDGEWEYRALSAKALGRFNDMDLATYFIQRIRDANWYVRLNSALALCRIYDKQQLLRLVQVEQDTYAKEIVYYAMFMSKLLTNEEYKHFVPKRMEVTQ